MKPEDIEQFDVVSAVFAPARTDDLVPGATKLIGQRLVFRADWIIDEGYPYEGDWHMTILDEDELLHRHGILWTPLCDLAYLAKIR